METTQLAPAPIDSRLDRTDAEFVSVIHTNAFGFGVFENIGHIDFWPDGGILQSGCLTLMEIIDEKMSKCRSVDYDCNGFNRNNKLHQKLIHFLNQIFNPALRELMNL